MDRDTVSVYEEYAERWMSERNAGDGERLRTIMGNAPAGWRADIGCGPGWHAPALATGGHPVLSLDASGSMCEIARTHNAYVVQADLEHLPIASGAMAATWAENSYQHVEASRLPMALRDLHRASAPGALLHLRVTGDQRERNGTSWDRHSGDPFGARHFSYWPEIRLRDVVTGAGFVIESVLDDGIDWLTVRAFRAETLADTVGPGMRLLLCGLNPSIASAHARVGFVRATNRFWRAALTAGIVSVARDPERALRADGVGMTDLVKRATPRADGLTATEYREGAARVERLVEWLGPETICFVGLSGYRVAIDRTARPGWQPDRFGGRPAYVMPSTSGANAHATIESLVAHLRAAASLPTALPTR